MSRSLRRSRRAPKRVSDYNCGDIVEINRNGTLYKGRLAQLLTEGTSPNPRWLIKFDSQNHKDEEIYERSFGKLLQAFDEEEPHSSESPVSAPRKPAKPQDPPRRRGSTGKNGGTSSEGETADEPRKEKTSAKNDVQFSQGSNTGSDHSSTPETSTTRRSARDRVSAREERSRRRQAKIDEETVLPGGETLALVGGKRRPPPPPHQPKKRQREDDQGEVVKVKLLTGTLYLYRGRHRRAEFIRRV